MMTGSKKHLLLAFFCFLMIHEIAVFAENTSKDNVMIVPNEWQMSKVEGGERSRQPTLLSRKRRYLEFPVGSSFQLVYDLIVGVVDYTNYLILGVTVALAWELPSKPPSEILDQLKERLKDGTLANTRNDSIAHLNYVNGATGQISHPPPLPPLPPTVSSFHPPIHYSYYVPPSNENFYRTQPFPSHQSWQSIPSSKYPWWSVTNRFRRNPLRPEHRSYYRRHRIYPVFGKRSVQQNGDMNVQRITRKSKRHGIINDNLNTWDRLHVQYHRTSRQDLYQRIESYLDKRGLNGQECVLRALCETEHKSHEQEPGSFVGELMRTLFTLPEPLDEEGGEEFLYDKAHKDTECMEDCQRLYSQCPQSIWTSDFIH